MKIVIWIRKILGTFNLYQSIEENNRLLHELNWANIFYSTISNSKWLKDRSFSPGRWAVGYPFLYVLYRLLDEVKPKNILEFGLGQSSRMLNQYTNYCNDVDLTTLEHDESWIALYKKKYELSPNSKILLVENIKINFNGFETLSIKNLQNVVQNKKFDLILLDAPFGSERYSRSQILSLIPNNVDKNHFCIIIDDYHRNGEKETCQELEYLFLKFDIKFNRSVYKGDKDFMLYCSNDLNFLLTL